MAASTFELPFRPRPKSTHTRYSLAELYSIRDANQTREPNGIRDANNQKAKAVNDAEAADEAQHKFFGSFPRGVPDFVPFGSPITFKGYLPYQHEPQGLGSFLPLTPPNEYLTSIYPISAKRDIEEWMSHVPSEARNPLRPASPPILRLSPPRPASDNPTACLRCQIYCMDSGYSGGEALTWPTPFKCPECPTYCQFRACKDCRPMPMDVHLSCPTMCELFGYSDHLDARPGEMTSMEFLQLMERRVPIPSFGAFWDGIAASGKKSWETSEGIPKRGRCRSI